MPKILFDEEGDAIGNDEALAVAEEQTIVEQVIDEPEEDSDDEAPEAISATSAKEFALRSQKAKKDQLARAAAEEKERRRQREQRLKEQKQGSKRDRKQQKRKQREESDRDEEADDDADSNDEGGNEEEHDDDGGLLPEELLAQAAAEEEEKATRKGHLRAEDLERLAAELEDEEQSEAKQRKKKRRTEAGVRQVGEYTVKVLSKRPRAPIVDQELKSLKDSQSLYRKGLPRKSAILQRSEGLVGKAALQFRRR